MLKQVVVTTALGAAIVGAGTAALASSGSQDVAVPTTAATPTASSSAQAGAAKTNAAKAAHKHRNRVRLGRALHGTWVTKDAKTNAVVTHDAIHGTVSSVSPTSITLKAADGVSQTYLVTSTTTVRKCPATATGPKSTGPKSNGPKANGPKTKRAKLPASSIGAVKVGDHAIVIGTGTTTLTATRIVDGLKK